MRSVKEKRPLFRTLAVLWSAVKPREISPVLERSRTRTIRRPGSPTGAGPADQLAPGARTPRLRPVLGAHLAVPDRHQRLPDRAGQVAAASAAIGLFQPGSGSGDCPGVGRA